MGSPKTARDTRGVFPLSRVRIDQNASKPVPGRRLSNHVEWRIFITSQNILGDLQTRGFAQPIVLGMVRADTPPSRAEYQKCLYSQTLPPVETTPKPDIFHLAKSLSSAYLQLPREITIKSEPTLRPRASCTRRYGWYMFDLLP